MSQTIKKKVESESEEEETYVEVTPQQLKEI